ncbi:MAG TPA: pyrimidine dimer DNA glycosylase/endonuclease V [Rhodanobacteraceae bacterium]|nr:pyrimidine dimer DNA glycosylase/endonuclease V [Rhodanobacteraceae bacterium]
MRLWSLHPRYLDAKGLTAAWREALLARAVLAGQTRGYRAHPQLVRFAACEAPADAIEFYLHALHDEACERGYSFDSSKLRGVSFRKRLRVTHGQIEFELEHLSAKLRVRDPALLKSLPRSAENADLHPLFRAVPGPVESWERTER